MDENIMNDSELGLVSSEKGKFRTGLGKVGGFFKKLGARNIVILSSVLLIGVAVVLNFVLFGNSAPNVSDGEKLGEVGEQPYVEDSYFASAQLSRQQARDQAIAVLQTVVASAADEVSREQASADISRIAAEIETEASIETLIKSKGFEECVAVISDGGASVIVRSDGLLPNELSQIKEIVWEQAGIDPLNIKIIEKSAA